MKEGGRAEEREEAGSVGRGGRPQECTGAGALSPGQ